MENKIITIKKLENGKYYIDLHEFLISFIISFIFIFPLIFIPSKNLILSFLSVLLFWIFLSIILKFVNFFGKKAHKKILEKKIFQDLLKQGFKRETIGEYEGLITTKNGRTIRVFYNWNKLAEGPLSFGDIDINLLYEPPFLQSNQEQVDMQKLNLLTKKFDKTLWSKTKRTLFTYNCLRICINYYPWTKSKKINDQIIRGLQILEDADLKKLDIKNIYNPKLEELYNEGYFLPNMELIWEYQEKNCR